MQQNLISIFYKKKEFSSNKLVHNNPHHGMVLLYPDNANVEALFMLTYRPATQVDQSSRLFSTKDHI